MQYSLLSSAIILLLAFQPAPIESKLNVNDVGPAYDVITRTFGSPDVKEFFELRISQNGGYDNEDQNEFIIEKNIKTTKVTFSACHHSFTILGF